MEKSRSKAQLILALVFLSMLFGVVYSVPYVKSVFYDGMLALTGASNENLGVLMTIYGIGEIVTPGIGGILAKKYDHIAIIVVSSLGTAAGCLLLAIFPSFWMAVVVWTILVFSTLFMVWGSFFKAMRLLVSDEKQGQLAGWFAGLIGLNYLVANLLCLYIYDAVGKGNDALGMKAVFFTFTILIVVVTIATAFLLRKVGVRNDTAIAESRESDAGTKVSFLADFKAMAKYRSVWYFGGTLFCIYSASISLTYSTPYFTDVLGMSTAIASIIAIARTYGTKVVGAPMGGILAGKLNSVAKAIILTFVGTLICMCVILPLATGSNPSAYLTVFIVLVIVAALFNNAGNGIQYALPTEGRVPVKYYAAGIGFGSAVGFAPDLYQHVLFGHWIDVYGSRAYNYIFIYGIVASVLGVALLILCLRDTKRIGSADLKINNQSEA